MFTVVTVIIQRVASAALVLKPAELFSRPPADVPGLSVLYLEHSLSGACTFSHPSSCVFQVLVWHTRTEKPHLANEPKHRKDTVVIEVWKQGGDQTNARRNVSGRHVRASMSSRILFSLLIRLMKSLRGANVLRGAAWSQRSGFLSDQERTHQAWFTDCSLIRGLM